MDRGLEPSRSRRSASKRCGETATNALSEGEAPLAKAHENKLVRLDDVRADTTVVEANVAYPTDSGLLAKGVAKLARLLTAQVKVGGAGIEDTVP